LRGTLGSFLVDAGRPQEAIEVYRSLLTPLAADLDENHAAYPGAEVLVLPKLMLGLAQETGDPALVAETRSFAVEYFEKVSRGYPGSDAERIGLLEAADVAMAVESWEEASEILENLATRFPDQEPWRAELRRARLLSEHLGRSNESETILKRWAEGRDKEATVAAGKQFIRLLLHSGRTSEAEMEIRRIKKLTRNRQDIAELLFLWGWLELEQGSWEEARPRWGQAAATQPYSRYGLESQLNVAQQWALREEPRFAARALSRLFSASRRNTRHSAGSEMARLSLEIESRADSLLGTLPATEPTVRNLLDRRGPRPDAP
jgi:tetratricopeptide (TPR) repeat protein